MAEVVVRKAGGNDAAAIAGLQARTWRYAYADLLPEQVLDGLDAPESEQRWAAALADPATTTFLAAEGDALVGYCVAGSAPKEAAAGVGGELPADAATLGMIGTLLVEPRWGRRGHGGRLLAAAAEVLRGLACTRGITWVPEADHATLAFYEGAGWRADGLVRTLDAAGTPVREARLSGALELHAR